MYHFFVDLLQPFQVFYLLTGVGLFNLWRYRAESKRRLLLLTVPYIVLTVVCMPFVAYWAMGSLEWQNPPPVIKLTPGATIVVLAGWAHRPNDYRQQTVLGMDSQLRCIHAAELHRMSPESRIVVPGGKVNDDDEGPPLGELMRDYLVYLGVPETNINVENQSRDTYENAAMTANLLRESDIQDIVLVTSATHLPRAVRCFEAQGLRVTPSACHHRATNYEWSFFSFIPSDGGASGVHTATHEWLGILSYWITGKFQTHRPSSAENT